jgi:ribosomal protein S18 acetylase RimI-like enzyme
LAQSIRLLRFSDIYSLNKMYDCLSDESKCFFHPGFIGFKYISINWLMAQVALASSSFAQLRRLLRRIYPFASILALVSADDSGKIIGFAFVKRQSRNPQRRSIGEFGLCVSDDYQQRHIGSEILAKSIELARKEGFDTVLLTVLTINSQAIHLYEKSGFQISRIIKNGERWNGKIFDSYEMVYYLTH